MCVGELCDNAISHAAEVSVPQMCLHCLAQTHRAVPWITL